MYTRTFICILCAQFYLSNGIIRFRSHCDDFTIWQRYRNRQFGFVQERLTWFQAQTVCKSLGGKLANVETALLNQFMIRMTNSRSFVWIGGADIHREGDWKWYNPETPMNFTYWHHVGPQPNNGRTSNCLSYWYKNGAYKWADEPCERKYYFICEK